MQKTCFVFVYSVKIFDTKIENYFVKNIWFLFLYSSDTKTYSRVLFANKLHEHALISIVKDLLAEKYAFFIIFLEERLDGCEVRKVVYSLSENFQI